MELQNTRYQVGEDGVALVTLDRPQRLNAFTRQMGDELEHIFQQADQDDSVRAVVVTGAGDAFCAGADLGAGGATFDFSRDPERAVSEKDHRDAGGRMALAIYHCRKPVIAGINGPAVGVGLTLTLAMDMRVAAEDAKVGFVFTRRGVVPEACSPWFLPRLVGRAKAAELILSGRVFRAREEAHSGLFNYVLPRERVLPKALELAREIAANTSAVCVALAKALLNHGLATLDPRREHLLESRVFHWAGRQADCYEGIQSFLEKRPPRFSMSPTRDMPEFYPWDQGDQDPA